MPAQLLVLYRKPADAAAFDAHYTSTHVPLAKAMPGVRGYRLSQGGIRAGAGASDLHLVAEIDFDSLDDLQAALASPQGKAAARDLGNFAQAGVELLMFDTKEA